MSIIDPDERDRKVAAALRPVAGAAIALALLAGPACALILWRSSDPDGVMVPIYLIWLFITVGAGIFCSYVLQHLHPLSVGAYVLAGAGAMVLLFAGGLGGSSEAGSSLGPLIVSLVLYGISAVLYLAHRQRTTLRRQTMSDGVDTEAEVTRAGISGQVNYVPLWYLTLKFTDLQGTTRWFRTHIVGFRSFTPGDRILIRYDPAHPDSKQRIVVSPPGSSDA